MRSAEAQVSQYQDKSQFPQRSKFCINWLLDLLVFICHSLDAMVTVHREHTPRYGGCTERDAFVVFGS